MLKNNKGSEIIGQLRVLRSDTNNEIYEEYIADAIELILSNENNADMLAETIAALDMMSYKYSRREAEALRDTVEYLGKMYAEG